MPHSSNHSDPQEPMIRKPILMPAELIQKVEKLAQAASAHENRSVSFAEVVRRALDVYSPELSREDNTILEVLADALIQATEDTVAYLNQVEKKLDETHALFKEHDHGLDR